MWPLGHAAVAYLCYTGLQRARTETVGGLAVVALLVGSQFPDLVDKPLSWSLGVLPTGRTLAHSLLILGPFVGLVYALTVRYDRAEYGIAFGVGAILHVLTDSLPVLWGEEELAFLLWPVVAVEPYPDGAPTVGGLLVTALGSPYLLAEFVLAAIAVVVWRADGYPGVGLFLRRLVSGSEPETVED